MHSKRVIFLVDMNSFFISCEGTRHPEIIGKPAAVAGDPKNRTGIILTSNYEARKFGVKTAMVVHEARKLCPNLQLISPDHHFYKQKSHQVMEILSCYTPVIQQNSIDEAWLDMTGCEGIFGSPLESAKQIMDKINSDLGLWCSIGISENKFLSKMASEMKKPQGITQLWNEDIESKLWPIRVESMYGIGKQTADKLHRLGIVTIHDLAHSNRENLFKKLGKSGAQLHQLANGIDLSPVVPHCHDDVKSIGKSITLTKDITSIEDAKIVLMKLSDEIGITARKHEKKGRTIQINIKYSNFQSITRQTTITPTYLIKQIYNTGVDLLTKNWDNKRPVRLLGISLSGFDEDSDVKQLSMFEMPQTNPIEEEHRLDKLEDAMDTIRNKYGSSIINRAVLMKKSKSK